MIYYNNYCTNYFTNKINFIKIIKHYSNNYSFKNYKILIMLDSKKLERFARYLNKTLPETICHLTDDLDSKIKKILITQLSCIDFITKDEFNIQNQNISDIQEKLKKIEKRLKILESIANNKLEKN